MRRVVPFLLVALALPGSTALAKFGMSKTKVILQRVRPPEAPPMADNVAVEVRSATPEVTGSHVNLVRTRLEGVLREGGGSPYHLVERTRDADAVVKVVMSALRTEVRGEVRVETKYQKTGERTKWNDKKKKNETEDVYENVKVPVKWVIAEGSIAASVDVEGATSVDASSTYREEFKEGSDIPPQATTEEALGRFLVGRVADRAVGAVAFSPDPVEALLAVNGELKDGNKFAQAGQWDDALREWTRKVFKGDTEAARLHNVGVAHEAMAYRLPPQSPEHRDQLEQARDFYLSAQKLDRDEKYFRDPPGRVEISLGYAAGATRFMADLDRYREEHHKRSRTAAAAGAKEAPAASKAGTAKAAPVVKTAGSGVAGSASASAASALRNGSFESSLSPWAVSGKGDVVDEAKRGHVLQVAAGSPATSVSQAVDIPIEAGRSATLSLDYRVTAGEGQLKSVLSYVDTTGKDRTATLPVIGGEQPGAWSPWTADVAALRPRPSRIKEVRIVVDSGTVRLDNVALTVK